jgi:hypothetical protein
LKKTTSTSRIGSDFEERLEKSKLAFRWEMLQRIESTMEGISQAIETGMSRKLQGEQAVEKQKAFLLEKEKGMSAIEEKVIQIRENLSTKMG